MQTKTKYLIAVIPPEPIYSEIIAFKNEIHKNYNSKGSLNSPPHITLHMPFEFSDKKLDLLYSSLDDIAKSATNFEVELSNFGFFEPRVIFVAVEKNDALADLHFKIKEKVKLKHFIFNANYRDRIDFRPHITIGFRDLKKEQFYLAKTEFEKKEFKKSFAVNSFFLLEKKDKTWEIKKEFTFNA
ncbi:MAG: 2'-5' RNA ligase family protein [Bacteroidota bacterium]